MSAGAAMVLNTSQGTPAVEGTGSSFLRTTVGLSIAGALGVVLAISAWGPGRTPALALLLPLLWVLSPSRMFAMVLVATYHLGVSRFLPGFASVWFDSLAAGYLIWLGHSFICGLAWALCWPSRATTTRVVLGMVVVSLVTLLPPVALVLAGHPIVGMGYIMPGSAWVGVGLYMLAMPAAAWLLRVKTETVPAPWKWPVRTALLVLAFIVLEVGGSVPDPQAGKVAGAVGALESRWGAYPQRGSLEVMLRIGQIGMATQKLSGGQGELQTVVFPESVIGVYDPTVFPAVKREILNKTIKTGQTVVIGADLEDGNGGLQKAALIFRPDGTSSYVVARQPVPLAEWAPWRKREYFSPDWLSKDTAAIGGGIVARFVFCFEEYIPALHLLSEWRGEHQMIVVLSNLWASNDPLTSSIQASHTEGMARLFNRPWVRALNLAKPPGNGA